MGRGRKRCSKAEMTATIRLEKTCGRGTGAAGKRKQTVKGDNARGENLTLREEVRGGSVG